MSKPFFENKKVRSFCRVRKGRVLIEEHNLTNGYIFCYYCPDLEIAENNNKKIVQDVYLRKFEKFLKED